MSLLSDLLASLPPTSTGAGKPRQESRPRLALVERSAAPVAGGRAPAPSPARASTKPIPNTRPNAASASPEWRKARDQYLNHALTCRSCYAPSARYCPTGADLRAIYDNTPMEPAQ